MDGTHRSRTTNLLARRVAALAAAAVAFSCAPALAADPATDFAPGSAPVQAAVDISKAHWQTDPCAGQVEIVWMTLTEQTNATSSWANPAGQYEHPELNTSCQIAFNKALAWDWTRFCSILVHEYGHLSGRAHADDPADVMYAYYEKPVAECVAAAPAQPTVVSDIVEAPPAIAAAAPTASTRAISPKPRAKRGWIVRVRHTHKHGHRHAHHRLTKKQRLARATRRAMRKWRAQRARS